MGPVGIQVCTEWAEHRWTYAQRLKEGGGLGRWAWGDGYQAEVLTRELGVRSKRGEWREWRSEQMMVVLSL